MSEKSIHEAINAIMGQVGYVQKQRGQNLNYTYASESALIEALRPEMVSHGVYMTVDEITNVSREQYATAKGSVMNSVCMLGKVRFTHAPSETSIVVWSHGEGADSGDKASNKALTGLYKYAIRQTFCIETGDDPDKYPSAEQERESKPQPKPAVKSNGNGHKPETMVETAKELGGETSYPQAVISAIVKAGHAKNDFDAKGMLAHSVLPSDIDVKWALAWAAKYRAARSNEETPATVEEAAQEANAAYLSALQK